MFFQGRLDGYVLVLPPFAAVIFSPLEPRAVSHYHLKLRLHLHPTEAIIILYAVGHFEEFMRLPCLLRLYSNPVDIVFRITSIL